MFCGKLVVLLEEIQIFFKFILETKLKYFNCFTELL
jgi:hypothetical protein